MNNLDKVTATIDTYRQLPANGKQLVKNFIAAMESAKAPAKRRQYRRKGKRGGRQAAA